MTQLISAVAALLLLAGPALAEAPAPVRDFQQASFESIVRDHDDQPFLLVLWSVDCPPCFREFEVFSDLRQEGLDVPLVLIATDPPDRRAEVVATLDRFNLHGVENWQFAGQDANRLRYEIDPAWYGEMPRGYFYAADGSRTAHSGGLTRDQVEAWLETL